MDKIDKIFTENGIKRPENLFYYVTHGKILVSLDCSWWYSLVFDEGLVDIVPFHHKNGIPYQLGVELGFYDAHTPIMP